MFWLFQIRKKRGNKTFFFYVPRSFRTWAVMALQSVLPLVTVTRFSTVLKLPIPVLPFIYKCSPGSSLATFSLSFLSSICIEKVLFSNPSFLIMYTRHFSCLFLILSISVFLSAFSLRLSCCLLVLSMEFSVSFVRTFLFLVFFPHSWGNCPTFTAIPCLVFGMPQYFARLNCGSHIFHKNAYQIFESLLPEKIQFFVRGKKNL